MKIKTTQYAIDTNPPPAAPSPPSIPDDASAYDWYGDMYWTDDSGQIWYYYDDCFIGYSNQTTGEYEEWDCFGFYYHGYYDVSGTFIVIMESTDQNETVWSKQAWTTGGEYDYIDSDGCQMHNDSTGGFYNCEGYTSSWTYDSQGNETGSDNEGCTWWKSFDGSEIDDTCVGADWEDVEET